MQQCATHLVPQRGAWTSRAHSGLPHPPCCWRPAFSRASTWTSVPSKSGTTTAMASQTGAISCRSGWAGRTPIATACPTIVMCSRETPAALRRSPRLIMAAMGKITTTARPGAMTPWVASCHAARTWPATVRSTNARLLSTTVQVTSSPSARTTTAMACRRTALGTSTTPRETEVRSFSDDGCDGAADRDCVTRTFDQNGNQTSSLVDENCDGVPGIAPCFRCATFSAGRASTTRTAT